MNWSATRMKRGALQPRMRLQDKALAIARGRKRTTFK